MTKKINGFEGNSEFGKFEIEPYYAGRIRSVTDDFHDELLALGVIYVRQEEFLFFVEIKSEIILAKISDLHTKYDKKYSQELLLYRAECNLSPTHCRFPSLIEEQIGLDASKCRLNQLGAVVATRINAIRLANRIKIYLFIIVFREPDLKNEYIRLLDQLGTWKMDDGETLEYHLGTRKMDDGETLEYQLIRDISLIANPRLRELFLFWLQDLGPMLETSFQQSEGCETFGQRKCVLCGDNFADTLLEPFPLPNLEDKTVPRHFYANAFRQQFYETLVEFLKLVQSD